MALTLDMIASELPSGAYDVQIDGFVARWKEPNRHKAEGFTTHARFFALPFIQAIQAALPELACLKICDYDGNPATMRTDRVFLEGDGARLWVTVQGWGASAFKQAEISAYAVIGKTTSEIIGINASLSRGPEAIAKDIARRILPKLAEAKAATKTKADKTAAEEKAIADKAAQLQRRYPNLKVIANVADRRVTIYTKYGAGVSLSAYVYDNGEAWRLTSDRGACFTLDDIDAPYGRAFLNLCNDN